MLFATRLQDVSAIWGTVVGWWTEIMDVINSHVLLQVLIVFFILDIYIKRVVNTIINNDQKGDKSK